MKAHNPTNKSKAVKGPGQLVVIKPGDSYTAEVVWDKYMIERYKNAGLEITGSNDAMRYEAIVAAMASLDDEGRTNDGTPKVDAVNDLLPEGMEPITAEERNAIWDEVK